jgi:hypothetical protein
MFEVEAANLTHYDPCVLLSLENYTKRRCDLIRRQRAGRDLVQQWLEQVKVTAIDECDVHRRVPKTADGRQAAEASPDNDHSVSRGAFTHEMPSTPDRVGA